MKITTKKEKNTLFVAVNGRIDSTTAPELEEALSSGLSDAEELVFDFKDLEYISSAGLRVLLASFKQMSGKMKLLNVNEDVKNIFAITGMSNIFTFN